jgi:hypothetical protein
MINHSNTDKLGDRRSSKGRFDVHMAQPMVPASTQSISQDGIIELLVLSYLLMTRVSAGSADQLLVPG